MSYDGLVNYLIYRLIYVLRWPCVLSNIYRLLCRWPCKLSYIYRLTIMSYDGLVNYLIFIVSLLCLTMAL